jgi:hypothetical protein
MLRHFIALANLLITKLIEIDLGIYYERSCRPFHTDRLSRHRIIRVTIIFI